MSDAASRSVVIDGERYEWAEPHALDGCDENLAARVQEARRVVATGDEAQIIAYLVGKPVEQVRKVMGDDRGT